MNTFGRYFRIHILGESHGPCVGVLIDGCPAGLALEPADFRAALDRRRGKGTGATPRREPDEPVLQSGLFRGRTTGTPLLISIANLQADSTGYRELRHTPRPGHADHTAAVKFGGFHDHRGGGHFSGRLTAGLVAAGVVAAKLIAPVMVEARLLEAGGSREPEAAAAAAREEGDSIGGIVECRATGVAAGLGEPFFDSVESLISHLVFSLGGVRAIEFGSGFACARMKGSECNDEIVDAAGATRTNHAGGVNGGLTNGMPLVYRVAVKPPSSIAKPQWTVDTRSGERVRLQVEGRHDACIATRMPVILEAATAVVLADLMLAEHSIPRIWSARARP